MNTCMKIVKLLIEKRIGGSGKWSIEHRIAEHLNECDRCADLRSEMMAPVVSRLAGGTSSSRFRGQVNAQLADTNIHLIQEKALQDNIGGNDMSNGQGIGTEVEGKFFTLIVDDQEFHIEESTITGGEIMDLAGIPREVGLIHVLEDGTQVQVGEDEVVELKPGRRFKKAPRFVRG